MRRVLIVVLLLSGLLAAPAAARTAPTTTGPGPTIPTTTAPPGPTIPTTAQPTAPPTAPSAPAPALDGTPPTVGITVNRERFSPNGDGNADRVTARITVDEAVGLTVVVRRAGTTVRTLLADNPAGPGVLRVDWLGRVDPGRRGADGAYTVRATATDLADNTSTAAATVVVDTTAPRFGWISVTPEPQTGTGPLTLRFSIRGEARPVTLTLGARDRFGVVARRQGVTRPPGVRAVGWRPTYRHGPYLYPGLFLLQVAARDDVGNVAHSPLRRFRIHRPVANRVVSSVPGAGRRVAITIDDCNDGATWSRMLAILRARRVHASFFCIGANVARFPDQARRTVADGHTVGSHTPDHAQVNQLSDAAIGQRLRQDQSTWWNVAHTTPSPFWRPPYGERGGEAAAGRTGFRWTMLWSIDPQDWERPGADAIAAHVLTKAFAGAVILIHVLTGTADALDRIITGLRARGLEPVSLAEMAHAAGLDRP